MPLTAGDLKDLYTLRLKEASEIVARTSQGEILDRWLGIVEGYRYLIAVAEAGAVSRREPNPTNLEKRQRRKPLRNL